MILTFTLYEQKLYVLKIVYLIDAELHQIDTTKIESSLTFENSIKLDQNNFKIKWKKEDKK